MRGLGHISAGVIAAAAALVPIAPAHGATRALDRAVQAAFLPKFARYVQWPPAAIAAPNAPLTICIVGADPFGDLIEAAARGQHVDGHPVQVRRMANAPDAAGCQIAYIGGRSASVQRNLRALAGEPVLTVTAYARDSARGIVNFVLDEGRVGFQIDDGLASRGGLVISARLLSLARNVSKADR